MKNLTYKRKQQTKHSIKEPNNPFSLSITVNDLENKQNVRKKNLLRLVDLFANKSILEHRMRESVIGLRDF